MSDKCSNCGNTHNLTEFKDNEGPGGYKRSLDGLSRMPENLDSVMGKNITYCNSCINQSFLELVDEANHGDYVEYLPDAFASLVDKKNAYNGLINTDINK
ncbi:MAG: hypothetical protein B6226_00725 [Candidatus Cloacimonetes bacterium 4572_65]|nr:MAG: hypothetical protein B6226_00725 [Candidatus Cloacimonetes bacterium 4572_65]